MYSAVLRFLSGIIPQLAIEWKLGNQSHSTQLIVDKLSLIKSKNPTLNHRYLVNTEYLAIFLYHER